MGLITVGLLVAMGLLLCGEAIKSKAAFLERAISTLRPQTENLGFWGVIYGLVALFLSMVGTTDNVTLALRLAGNSLIVVMGLMLAFDKIVGYFPKFQGAVLDEVRGVVTKFQGRAIWIGYAALGIAAVTFLKIFS